MNITSLQGIILILTLSFLTGCGPRSFEDFREEGVELTSALIQELKMIQTREQLLAASGKLQRFFDQLVTLIIAADEYAIAHPEVETEMLSPAHHALSDQLRVELNRLYQLEGGRQVIEKCQENALHRLDAFTKRSVKNYRKH